MYANIHTCIRTNIHTYKHTCIHTKVFDTARFLRLQPDEEHRRFAAQMADPKQVRGALPIERRREDAAFRAEWFLPALQSGRDTAWPVAPEALPAQVHSGGRSLQPAR